MLYRRGSYGQDWESVGVESDAVVGQSLGGFGIFPLGVKKVQDEEIDKQNGIRDSG